MIFTNVYITSIHHNYITNISSSKKHCYEDHSNLITNIFFLISAPNLTKTFESEIKTILEMFKCCDVEMLRC
jgi:hypothetical protein